MHRDSAFPSPKFRQEKNGLSSPGRKGNCFSEEAGFKKSIEIICENETEPVRTRIYDLNWYPFLNMYMPLVSHSVPHCVEQARDSEQRKTDEPTEALY